MLSLIAFLVIFSSFCVSNAREIKNRTEDEQKTGTLIFAHILFRHGDRNPIESYPTDPWRDEVNWPEGFGQLTNLGIRQEYELGLYLRDRYRTLLSDSGYSTDLVYVQSTDFDRTLMSAETVMAAMFPPEGDRIWNENLLWQPIPIHTIPKELDYILYGARPCPRFDRALENYLKSSEMVEFRAKYEQLFKYLSDNSGLPIQTVTDVSDLYDTLWIEQSKNKTLPEWTESVIGLDSDFERVALHDFLQDTSTSELARLSIGFLIRDILERCSKKIDETLSPDRSLWIYSAHDSTIASILNAFGKFNPHNPSYASSVHFELYEADDDFYLQVSYRNSSGEMLLDFSYCGTKWSIEDLQQIYLDIIPTESFEDECRLPLYIRVIESDHICGQDECIIALICLGVLVPIVLILSCLIRSRRRGNIQMDTAHIKN